MYLKTHEEWRSTDTLRQNPAYRSFLFAHAEDCLGDQHYTKIFDDPDRPCMRWTGIDVTSADCLFHAHINNDEHNHYFILANFLDAHTTAAEHQDFALYYQVRENVVKVKSVVRSEKQGHACLITDDGSEIEIPVEAQHEPAVPDEAIDGEPFAGCELPIGATAYHVFSGSGARRHRILCNISSVEMVLQEDPNAEIYEQVVSDSTMQLVRRQLNPDQA
jgi:hypothetical protein